METHHTKGQLSIDVITQSKEGDIWLADIILETSDLIDDFGFVYGDTEKEAKENAETLCRAWNNSQDMIEALYSMIKSFEGTYQKGSPAEVSFNLAKKAYQKATGQF